MEAGATNTPTVLAIGAHAADFVWRCSGTLSNFRRRGGGVSVVAMTFGERGESTALWKENPSRSLEEVKSIRRREAQAAAAAIDVDISFLDWGDHPLVVGPEREMALVDHLRRTRPDVVLTHLPSDPLNPDHPVASNAVTRAIRLAAAVGVKTEETALPRPSIFFFEPDQPEYCQFQPDTFVDISESIEAKVAAMELMSTQAFLVDIYRQRAEYRGYIAGRISGQAGRFAEAFERHTPFVGKTLE